ARRRCPHPATSSLPGRCDPRTPRRGRDRGDRRGAGRSRRGCDGATDRRARPGRRSARADRGARSGVARHDPAPRRLGRRVSFRAMNIRALIAELIGTFILVGVGSMSILSAGASQVTAIQIVPFGFGFALMAGIAMFGHISGAHFNPAVTLAAWIDRRLNLVSAIGYVVAQGIGAVIASMSMLILFSKDFVDITRNTPSSAVNDFQ